jgi:broad specificity phosphatase PhoE
MQTIILIRHGYPTSWDLKQKGRGTPPHRRIDPGLAEIGVKQARLSAEHIATTGGVGLVLSSPFRSCLETADAIAANGKVEIIPDWRLGEVLISQVLGCPFSPTGGMDPEWAARREGAGKPSHPESDKTLHDRVAKMVVDLKGRKPFAQRIVVVSHEIILKELFNRMTGRAITLDWHPCAMTTLVRPKPVDRDWRLRGEAGSFAHLGSDDRTEPTDQTEHVYHPLDSRS